MSRAALLLALSCVSVGCKGGGRATAAASGATLVVVGPKGSRSLGRAAMQRISAAETVTLYDPNYKAKKRYRAHPLVPLLVSGMALPAAKIARMKLLFIATDGYRVVIPGALLASGEPYLAVADLEHADWQGVPEHNGVKPGPLYVVWRARAARDMKRYPWPWQLASVQPSPADLYARTVPTSAPAGSAARTGHKVFLRDCIRCHAINRQGGRLGPDLNVPRNVLEYRDAKLLRRFIRNPLAFRYGAMPPQRQLSEADLDNVMAYLRAMQRHKRDPAARRQRGASGGSGDGSGSGSGS